MRPIRAVTASGRAVVSTGPGAHRYWRLYVTANNGNTSFGAGADEIEFRSTVGGADQTSPGAAATSASASSIINGSNTAAMAFDDNGGARWLSAAGLPQWIKWDFGAGNAKQILQLSIKGPNTAMTASPQDFTLQYSDDDIGWTTALSAAGITGWVASTEKTFNV